MSQLRKRTKAEERELAGMIDDLTDLRLDMALTARTREIVPAGWDDLHVSAPCTPPKARMTLRMDADVLDWYRGLGRGYQTRINQVLRAYMRSVVSKHIESPGDRDWLSNPL